jgi:PBP1b-binding outer membrane lipoprotein LpoB
MTRRIRFAAVSLLLILGFVLGGCSKITQANYEKIEMGMTYQEVVDILGAPDEMQDVMGAKSCVWGKDPNVIDIKFIGDKVVFHSAKGLS